MTIATTQSVATFLGNGATNPFQFSFIIGPASNAEVLFTDAQNLTTVLDPTQYTLYLNPPAVGALWGVGGTITYPKVGSPLANGESLTIQRILPITQIFTFNNQGTLLLNVVEQALDTLCLEIQQIAGRSGQFRGVWKTGVQYNYGDLIQDGVNGSNSLNYYFCAIANTSGTWATDLANGYWALAISAGAGSPNAVLSAGPSTNSAIALWDGITGLLIENSVVLIDGSGNITGGTWHGSIIGPAYGGTGVNNGSYTVTLGGNVSTAGALTTGGTFSTTGNFSTGGTFATGSTFSTTGAFSTGGAFTTGSTFSTTGAFSTGGAFSTTGTFTTGGTFATGSTFSTTGAFSTAGAFTTTGANSLTIATTGPTSITLPTSGTIETTAGTTAAIANARVRTVGFSAPFPTTGQQSSYYVMPVSGVITGWSIAVDVGTATIQTWKIAAGTATPTVANSISTAGVQLTTGTLIESTALGDFTTTTVTAGDCFAFNISALSGNPTKLSFQLNVLVN